MPTFSLLKRIASHLPDMNDFARSPSLIITSSLTTIVVVGSVIIASIQALWPIPFPIGGDFTIPFKYGVVMGYVSILGHLVYQLLKKIRNGDVGGALMNFVEVLLVGALSAAVNSYFLHTSSIAIVIPEQAMPFDVRVIVTAAFAFVAIFLLISVYALAYVISTDGRNARIHRRRRK
jgi:hypothetical protein